MTKQPDVQTKKKNITFMDTCLIHGISILYFLISVSFYLKTYDSAQIKITLLQVGGSLILGVWLIKLLELRENPFKGSALIIVAPLLIYWLLGPVSFLHSAYPETTVDELIRRIMYIGFALIIFFECNSYRKFELLMKWILAAGFVSSLYGIIQWLDINFFPHSVNTGLDPFIWRQAFGTRVFSTHGNPNFFGNFLVIIAPMILAFMLKELLQTEDLWKPAVSLPLIMLPVVGLMIRNKFPTVFNISCLAMVVGIVLSMLVSFKWMKYTIFFAMVSFNIVATGSKGAMLGYAAVLGIFAFLATFFFLKGRLKFLRVPIFTVMLIVMLVFGGLIFRLSVDRINSIRFRIFTWLSTIEMIQTHPIIGTGLGTFKITYPAYRRPEIFHIEGKSNTETDHPENEFLEIWYDDGIIGFGLFVWIIILFTRMGILGLDRFARIGSVKTGARGVSFGIIEDQRAYYLLGFLTAFLAMLTHNLVDVSLRFVSSGIFLWLLAGLIGALLWHEPLSKQDPEPQLPDPRQSMQHVARNKVADTLFILVKAVLIAAVCFMAFKIIKDFHVIQQPAPGPGQEKFFSWFFPWMCFITCAGGSAYALSLIISRMSAVPGFFVVPPVLFAVHIFWGFFVADANHNVGIFYSKKQQWKEALDHYNTVVRKNHNYIMSHYFMGNVYNDRWQPGDWKLALEKYNDVKKLAPNYVQVHHQTGMVYLKLYEQAKRTGDTEKAKEYWETAVHFFTMYHNLDPVFTKNYMHLGYLHVEAGRPAEAEQYYRQALQEKPDDLEAIVNLGNIRYLQNDYQDAEKQYQQALSVNPDYPGALKNLAILYGRIGKQKESAQLWYRLKQVNPNDPDVQRVFKQ